MSDAPAPASSPPPAAPAPSPVPPPQGFFSRVIANAGDYLKRIALYLGCIAAVVIAYWKIILPADEVPPGLTGWALFILAGVPLLIALTFEFLRWRRQRRNRLLIAGQAGARHFILGPREAKDHDGFSLPDDAHLTVTEWVCAAPHPVLHLTGLSGTGKSSLIHAWLIPELEAARSHRVILLRSFDDPLDCLRGELLGLWESPPKKAAAKDIPLADLLRLAADYLQDKDQRLLIIFDQFEEFFILHPQAEHTGPLRDFFQAILAASPDGVTLLLSYRKDHAHALAPLRLPPVSMDPNRNLEVNGFALRPFTIAEATAFFERSGLQFTPERLHLALAEAASYEETRAHIRPIVLNVLGRILATLSSSPGAASRARGLIRGQVRQWVLSTALQEDIRPLLEKLVSASGTVSPAAESELAAASGTTAARLQPVLNELETHGLLRCLSHEQAEPDKRVWQVSHDFIARLFALIIEGLNKTLWRVLRPWLAPAALGLWLVGIFVIWPQYQEKLAMSVVQQTMIELNRLGFTCDLDTRAVAQMPFIDRSDTQDFTIPGKWPAFVRCLANFGCKSLRIEELNKNFPIEGLQSVKTLEELDLSGCARLAELPDLSTCVQLKELVLTGCTGLQDAAALQGLTGLRSLEWLSLSGCKGLAALPDLSGCGQLKVLVLTDCTGLQDAAALQGLTGLRSLEWLSLSGCKGLAALPDLSGCGQLKELVLRHCTSLKDTAALQGIAKVESLAQLYLDYCKGLEALPDLSGCGQLRTLSLVGCTGLKDAAAFQPLSGLRSLERLELDGCAGLEALPDLSACAQIEELSLTGCTGLQDAAALGGLKGCTGLDTLWLPGYFEGQQAVIGQVRQWVGDGCEIKCL